MSTDKQPSLETLVSLAKRRGFIFQASEIYGGLAGFYDYGPYGTQLVRNLKQLWWHRFVERVPNIHGLDSAIIQNPRLWEVSGHVSGFTDPMTICMNCMNRQRADHLIEQQQEEYKAFIHPGMDLYESLASFRDEALEKTKEKHDEIEKLFQKLDSYAVFAEKNKEIFDESDYEKNFQHQDEILESIRANLKDSEENLNRSSNLGLLEKVMSQYFQDAFKYTGPVPHTFLNREVKCPICGEKNSWSEPRKFNMMFETYVGPLQEAEDRVYLRPETAGGIFSNFKNVLDTTRTKVPFGIAQVGKAFRNEISPRDFIFRLRELEQMEIEYFVHPDQAAAELKNWRELAWQWLKDVGLAEGNLHWYEHTGDERAHYAAEAWDIQFRYSFGIKELWGIANRTDYDLRHHGEGSGRDLTYFDQVNDEKYIPYVIEPSIGVDRLVLAVLTDAYTEEEVKGGEQRIVLKFAPQVAPVKAAVLPLLKNKPELVEKARDIFDELKDHMVTEYDEVGSIGKRYRRQDEIGTPFCVTIDFDSLEDDTVTVRDRDSMQQERVEIAELTDWIQAKLHGA